MDYDYEGSALLKKQKQALLESAKKKAAEGNYSQLTAAEKAVLNEDQEQKAKAAEARKKEGENVLGGLGYVLTKGQEDADELWESAQAGAANRGLEYNPVTGKFQKRLAGEFSGEGYTVEEMARIHNADNNFYQTSDGVRDDIDLKGDLNKLYATNHSAALVYNHDTEKFEITNGTGYNYSAGTNRLEGFEYEIFEYVGDDGNEKVAVDAVTKEKVPMVNGRFYVQLGAGNRAGKYGYNAAFMDVTDMQYTNIATGGTEVLGYQMSIPNYYAPTIGSGMDPSSPVTSTRPISGIVKPWNPLTSRDTYEAFMDIRANRNRSSYQSGEIDYATNLGTGNSFRGGNIYRGYYANTQNRPFYVGPARIDRVPTLRPH